MLYNSNKRWVLLMRVTIYDIAKKSGVSPSTVSRALNGDPRISKETRKKILIVAEESHYLANRWKKNESFNKKSKVIALMVTDIANPFFPEIVHGVEDLAFEHGFSVSLWNTREDPKRERDYAETLKNSNIMGIILGASRLPDEQVTNIVKSGIHCVLINRIISGIPCVVADYEFGAYQAVKYLLNLGHRKIAFLNGPSFAQTSLWREMGYIEAFHDNNLEVPKNLITFNPPVVEGGYVATLKLFNSDDRPTALFAYNDLVALGAMKAVREKNLLIPNDVSVMGYDDIFLSSYLDPPLSTVNQPKYMIGKLAMDFLLRVIHGERIPNNLIKLKPDLVIRSSCTVCV